MVVAAVAVIVFGVAASRAAIERAPPPTTWSARAAPLLLDAQDLYVALADADAAASTIFLRAGLEHPSCASATSTTCAGPASGWR